MNPNSSLTETGGVTMDSLKNARPPASKLAESSNCYKASGFSISDSAKNVPVTAMKNRPEVPACGSGASSTVVTTQPSTTTFAPPGTAACAKLNPIKSIAGLKAAACVSNLDTSVGTPSHLRLQAGRCQNFWGTSIRMLCGNAHFGIFSHATEA